MKMKKSINITEIECRLSDCYSGEVLPGDDCIADMVKWGYFTPMNDIPNYLLLDREASRLMMSAGKFVLNNEDEWEFHYPSKTEALEVKDPTKVTLQHNGKEVRIAIRLFRDSNAYREKVRKNHKDMGHVLWFFYFSILNLTKR